MQNRKYKLLFYVLQFNEVKVLHIDIVRVTKKLISLVSAFRSNYFKADCACHSKRHRAPTHYRHFLNLSYKDMLKKCKLKQYM